jgi:hypothetical protein
MLLICEGVWERMESVPELGECLCGGGVGGVIGEGGNLRGWREVLRTHT